MKVTATHEYDTDKAIGYASSYASDPYVSGTIRALVARIEELEKAKAFVFGVDHTIGPDWTAACTVQYGTPASQPHRQRCERRKPEVGQWVWDDGGGTWFEWFNDAGGNAKWTVAPGATEAPKYPPGCEPETTP